MSVFAQALVSVHQDAISFSQQELHAKEQLRALAENGGNRGQLLRPLNLESAGCTFTVPNLTVEGQSVQVHFQLPAGYPQAAAQLRLSLCAPRCDAASLQAQTAAAVTSSCH
jgi:hypothetical protein